MGREFLDVFEKWADSYDDTVHGQGEEYREVFEGYEEILSRVAEKSIGTVVEFGIGTGNSTKKLLEQGLTVIGIEPSAAMRAIAQKKFADLSIYNGDFLQIPDAVAKIDTFASSYAFHHLTDQEKEQAIRLYSETLGSGGKVVFADTVYDSLEAKAAIIRDAEEKGYENLLKDLQTEYYTTVDVIKNIFLNYSFTVQFTRLNKYVMLIDATKK